MAEIANTLWYRLGTISVTDGSTTVTGVGTHWTTAGINPGATLRVDGKYLAHEVKRVVSDTEIELGAPYYGGSASAATYSIDRNFQSTTNAKLAADVTDLVGIYEQVRDGTMPMIEGKSAYQIAVANGFTGTEAEWLESLKGGGEIVSINGKLDKFYVNNAGAHNSFCRGKNLGTSITPEQIAAIRNGSYDDLYVGDFWELPLDGTTIARIMGCGLAPHGHTTDTIEGGIKTAGTKNLTVFLWNITNNWVYPINDTNTTEGHLKNSKLYTETLPTLLEHIEAVIDPSYIKTFSEFIADATDANGVPTHSVLENMRLFLPSARNCCLSKLSSIDPDTNSAYQAVSKIIWPYFLYQPHHQWNTHWLDASYSDSRWFFKYVQTASAGNDNPSKLRWVAPYIFLG